MKRKRVSDINILKRIETEHDQEPAQVMERLNISKSSYSMIKNDKMPVSKKLAIRINQAYNYSLEDILLRPDDHYNPLISGGVKSPETFGK